MSTVQLQNILQQGVAHHRAGRLAEALAIYTRVRSIAPRNFDAWHLAGTVAIQQGNAAEAVTLLAKALALSPRSAIWAMRLGVALISVGRMADAERYLRAAVQMDPKLVEGWDNLAYALRASDRLPEAIECHQRVTALNASYAIGWYNYGLTLSLQSRCSEALACHDRAAAADPRYAQAHFGRAQALQQLGLIPEAVDAYGKFLAAEPRHWEAHSYRLFALHYLDNLSREQLFAEHVEFGRRLGAAAPVAFSNEPEPERKLRVGILSPDLRQHACAYFLEPLLRHLDRERFEICLYHDHYREDSYSKSLRATAAIWRNFVGQSNETVEKAIRADRPDILIDLAGHTGLNRLPLFARRVAPVQISYLGYPNTTGVRAMDYRLTDAVVDPLGEADPFATEKLLRFAPTAWAFQPSASAPAPGTPPCTASDETPVVFGCFNNLAKVSDSTLQLWGRVLAAVPHSRLLLKGRGLAEQPVRERYLARCTAAGLAAERIEFLERTEYADDHLALYARMDVALDTFPYHGTTTTCEALWMGVPVVTQLGDRHVARVSGSLLTAVDHPEWIAANADDYVRIAAGLASDRARLIRLRGTLREEMRGSALLDHASQSARFGAALRDCWRDWCASQSAPGGS